ncbi:histidine kinase [Xylanimonas oleitrophica]|uniref:Histidine kinase n=1 Tax=Xylanimonas oleitrophica TaxID=2607479 RepID=A0A2W5WU41_9MICO|nr:Rv3654c family TadE-like protein [Xylanimonas oleitrophica]PZR51756.1 histidine kinase [Xylanimonas oleitrophica]
MSRAVRAHERGSGTVLLLGVAAVVVLLFVALAALGASQRARGAAQAAADLGALAAATALRGGLDPCGAAAEAVVRNQATVVGCEQEAGGVVSVAVTRPVAGVPGWAGGEARAEARAGPRPQAWAP